LNYKDKTLSGILWNAVGTLINSGVVFLVSIVLARLLTPYEFGLIGMTVFFIAISQTFIESGFSSALIRKTDSTEDDNATVFYYNLAMGMALYGVLFVIAGPVAAFFDEPILRPVIRVLGLDLVIRSLTIIQVTLLIKKVNFKLLARINIIAAVLSGGIAISMAYSGYGVWSLVIRSVSAALFMSVMLWVWSKWRPIRPFSKASFRELFGFGSRLLASGLLETTFNNIYYLVIGKYFAARELGFFTRAQMFVDLPAQQLTGIISKVSYPILSELRDQPALLYNGYRRMITGTSFVSFSLMLMLAAMAEPLVLTLIGEPWRPAILYLRMLSFVGMLYPLHALNLNMLNVMGRSDLFLRLEIIKKALLVPVIVLGVLYGIPVMIAGMMIHSAAAFFLNSHWSGQMSGYTTKQQLIDLLPPLCLAAFSSGVVYWLGLILPCSDPAILLAQCVTGITLIIGLGEMFRISPYLYIKEIIVTKIQAIRHARE
jgi:teichuronic acid exporter